MSDRLASLARLLARGASQVLEVCAVLSPFVTPLAVPGYARAWPAPARAGSRSVAPLLDPAREAAAPGPPPDHPERLLPAGTLSEVERRLWSQLLEP